MPRIYYHGTLADFANPEEAIREVQVGGRVLTWFPRFTSYTKLKNVVRQEFTDRWGKKRRSIGDKWKIEDKENGPAVYWLDLTDEEWDHAQLNRYNRDKLLRLDKPEMTPAEKRAEIARLQAELDTIENVKSGPKTHWKKKVNADAETFAESAAR